MITRTRTPRILAGLMSLALVAAACGSDDETVTTEPPAVEETTADTMDDAAMDDEAMDDEAMDDEAMDDAAMDDEAMDDAAMDEATMPTGPLCSAVPTDGEGSFAGMTDDPAATAASNNPVLSTLVTAVGEAGLVDTLNSDGPFTIFAPANPAFEAIPADQLDAVLADPELLTSILTLHVVAGQQLSSTDLAALDSIETVNGAEITFEATDDGMLMVNDQATVGCADIQTANATVHVIDAVLMP